MTEWKIDLPIVKPLSLNDRVNRYRRNAEIQSLKRAVMLLARNVHHIPRQEHVEVQLHWVPNTKRSRDGDNPFPTVKACCDGLKLAGVVEDDTTDHVTHLPVVIHDPVRARHGRLFLVVRQCNPELQETK